MNQFIVLKYSLSFSNEFCIPYCKKTVYHHVWFQTLQMSFDSKCSCRTQGFQYQDSDVLTSLFCAVPPRIQKLFCMTTESLRRLAALLFEICSLSAVPPCQGPFRPHKYTAPRHQVHPACLHGDNLS